MTRRSSSHRVHQQPAWILHSADWRETSVLAEAFTRDYGRVTLTAKGARRIGSRMRGMIWAFQPLALSWSGKAVVKNLTGVEWVGGLPFIEGSALLSAYYVNELILRFLPPAIPHPELFSPYAAAMKGLANLPDESDPLERRFVTEWILRSFELILMRELGYGPRLTDDADGRPLVPEAWYDYHPESGARRLLPNERCAQPVQGQTLIDMRQGRFADIDALQQSKDVLRRVIQHQLGGQMLSTRALMLELNALKRRARQLRQQREAALAQPAISVMNEE